MWNQAGSGSAFPDSSLMSPPQVLDILTTWATCGSQNVDNIFPSLCFCSWCSLPQVRWSSIPTPNFSLWVWSPEAILITCAHHPLQQLDVIPKLCKSPKTKKGGKMGRRKGRMEICFLQHFQTLMWQITFMQGRTFYSFICFISPIRTKAPWWQVLCLLHFYILHSMSMGQSDIQGMLIIHKSLSVLNSNKYVRLGLLSRRKTNEVPQQQGSG